MSAAVAWYPRFTGLEQLFAGRKAIFSASPALEEALLDLPLETTLVPRSSRGNVSPTYSRPSVAYVRDHEGKPRAVLSGEARFQGARRVRNWIAGSSVDFSNASWLRDKGGSGVLPDVTANYATAPDGTLTASRLELDPGGTTVSDFSRLRNLVSTPGFAGGLGSVWLKTNDGTTKLVRFRSGPGTVDEVTLSVTGEWQRFSGSISTLTTGSFELYAAGPLNGGAALDLLAWGAQWEQANQNPSEYISVGVLSAPYHGAGVDGVKDFATENGNTVSGNVVTEATGPLIPMDYNNRAWLPGVAGSYFSTPDSPAVSITGDIDIRAEFASSDWSPATNQSALNKHNGTGGYELNVVAGTAGFIRLWYGDGVQRNVTSTAGVPFADGTSGWVRVTRVAATGVVTFYYKFNIGDAWTQLGNAVAGIAGAIVDNGNAVQIGNTSAGVPFLGTVRRVQVFDEIDGDEPVLDFDVNDWRTGTTFTSSRTGETWTLNGGAVIRNFRRGWYLPEVAATNICLQSEDLATTWADANTPTHTAAAKRIGDVVLALLGDDDAAALEGKTQTITFTGDAVKVVSFYWAPGTSTSSVLDLADITAADIRMRAVVTHTAGVPTVTMSVGTHIGTEQLADGGYRIMCATTTVTAANTNSLQFYPAADASHDVSLTGNCYFGGVMVQNATTPGSYVKTTTAAATRARDDLDYLNFLSGLDATGLTMLVEGEHGYNVGNDLYAAMLHPASGSNPGVGVRSISTPAYTALSRDAAGGNHDGAGFSVTPTNGARFKGAISVTQAGAVTGAINGGLASVPGSGMTDLDDLTSLQAGQGYNAGNFGGPVGGIKLYAAHKSDAWLVSRTT